MSIKDDLKRQWNKPNNTTTRLILVNVIFWAVFALLKVFLSISFGKIPGAHLMSDIQSFFAVSADPMEVLIKPWTIISYSFVHYSSEHYSFLNILMNMLMLYWFGTLFRHYMDSSKLFGLYILGAIGGAVPYLIGVNTIDFWKALSPSMEGGASASVYAIITAVAFYKPQEKIHLFLLGAVKLVYVALAIIFFSVIALAGDNAGAYLAHLGGALVGFIYAKQYAKNRDIASPINRSANWLLALINRLITRKPKMKASYSRRKEHAKATAGRSSKASGASYSSESYKDQATIDRILDKISESGYENLTQEEKQILFRASQK